MFDYELTRRRLLGQMACGFGGMALGGLLAGRLQASQTHFPAKAKRIIFLFMQGGPSHVDTFDYKPRLVKDDGEKASFHDARTIANKGEVELSEHRLMGPRWNFSRHGESGLWGSDLLPEMCSVLDECCVINSMHTNGIAHGPATIFLHTGSTNQIRPSMGSWVSYGLGNENENLPSFVTISPSTGNGGARNYGSAFLPAIFQGTPLGTAGAALSKEPMKHLSNPLRSSSEQQKLFELVEQQMAAQMANRPEDALLNAELESMELAWRMQSEIPSVLDESQETEETLKLYGIDQKETAEFGRKCLMARRLAESGVRYIQVTYGSNSPNPAWDQHSNIETHEVHAKATDKPVAGLIKDLKRRGLLEDTIVWWGGEFGRTPYAQKNGTGRDHNSGGFSVLLAGGGFKPGISYGATDEFGQNAIENKVHMHDLHATILHQLGLDHEKLTYRFAGRDFRLTDVHGRVLEDVVG